MADINVSKNGHLGTVELNRPPEQFSRQMELIGEVAGAFEALHPRRQHPRHRTVLGRNIFLAGANLGQRLANEAAGKPLQTGKHLYHEANIAWSAPTSRSWLPCRARRSVQDGPRACRDFRVGCTDARFSTNFARQGYHPGFGTTHILQRIVGAQKASWLLYTGERIDGEELSRSA